MKIQKPWVSWEEFEALAGGSWTPAAHTHVKADITDTPWAWADVSKAGSNLTDLATRQHAGLTDVTSDLHHAQDHAAEHEVGGGDLLAFADITGFGTYLDQAVKQASSPIHVTVKLSALTDGYVPYHVSDAVGLANSPIRIDAPGVGIGIAPVAPNLLHIAEAAAWSILSIDCYSANGFYPTWKLRRSRSDVLGTITETQDGDILGSIFFQGVDNAPVFDRGATIQASQVGASGSRVGAKLTLDTYQAAGGRNVNQLHLAPDGKVGVGMVPTKDFHVNGDIQADTFLLAAGVTPNLGWLSDITLGSLEEGETIRYDQATAMWIDAWGIDYDNPRLVYKMWTEFFSPGSTTNDPWVGASLAGGTCAAAAATSNHPGQIRLSTGAVIGGGYRFMTAVDCIRIAGAEHSEFIFQTPPNFANVYSRLGFQDSITTGVVRDGVYVSLIANVLAGQTRNNLAASTTGTSYNMAVSTWYRAKIAVNSNATLVTFVLYSAAGVVLWTNTLAANIPTAAGRETGHGFVTWVSIAAVRVLLVLDMMIATRAGYITR